MIALSYKFRVSRRELSVLASQVTAKFRCILAHSRQELELRDDFEGRFRINTILRPTPDSSIPRGWTASLYALQYSQIIHSRTIALEYSDLLEIC